LHAVVELRLRVLQLIVQRGRVLVRPHELAEPPVERAAPGSRARHA
jgi:hypothetical protein